MATQIKGKYVLDGAINGSKLLLDNNQAFRAKDASGAAQDLLKLDAQNDLVFVQMPKVLSDAAGPNDLVRLSKVESLIAEIELDDLSGVTLTSAASGEILRYNGTGWVNEAAVSQFAQATSGSNTENINSLIGTGLAAGSRLYVSGTTATNTDSRAYYSTNGGSTWQLDEQIGIVNSIAVVENLVYFDSPSNSPALMKLDTSTGNITLQYVFTGPTPYSIESIAVSNNGQLIYVLIDNGVGGFAWQYSTDGGSTFAWSMGISGYNPVALTFVNNTVYAISHDSGQTRISKSTGDDVWTDTFVYQPNGDPLFWTATSIAGNSSALYASGYNSASSAIETYYSTDGGESWSLSNLSFSPQRLASNYFSTTSFALKSENDAFILYSSPGSTDIWTQVGTVAVGSSSSPVPGSENRVVKTNSSGYLDQTLLQYDVNFGGYKLQGVASPVSDTDAANKFFVESKVNLEASSRIAAINAEATARQNAVTDLQGKINTEKGRIDAILSASDADKDSFAEIVALINSVDTQNDNAFGAYVTSNNAAINTLSARQYIYEYANLAAFPVTGETQRIYVAKDTDYIYRYQETVLPESYDWVVGSGGDFATLAAALASASVLDGHKIKLLNGTYESDSTINISKKVKIYGESRAGVILQTSASTAAPATMINVSVDDVVLKDLTIKHRKTNNTSVETAVVASGGGFPQTRIKNFIMDNCLVEHVEFGVVVRGEAWKVANSTISYMGPTNSTRRHMGVYGFKGDCFVMSNVFKDNAASGSARAIAITSTTGTNPNETNEGNLVVQDNSQDGPLAQFISQDNFQGSAGSYSLYVKNNTTNETSAFVSFYGTVANFGNILAQVVVQGNSLSNLHGGTPAGGKGIIGIDGAGSVAFRSSSLPIYLSGNTLGNLVFRTDYIEATGSIGSIAGKSSGIGSASVTLLDSSIPSYPSAPATPSAGGGTSKEYVKLSPDTGLLKLDGSRAMAAALDMGGFKVTNAATPTASGDLSTKEYVDQKVSKAGDAMSGALAMGSNKITGLASPTADADAATKLYVDSKNYSLDSLSDVTLTSVTSKEILKYNGSQWVNEIPLSAYYTQAGAVTQTGSLDKLTVTTVSETNSSWEAFTQGSGEVSPTALVFGQSFSVTNNIWKVKVYLERNNFGSQGTLTGNFVCKIVQGKGTAGNIVATSQPVAGSSIPATSTISNARGLKTAPALTPTEFVFSTPVAVSGDHSILIYSSGAAWSGGSSSFLRIATVNKPGDAIELFPTGYNFISNYGLLETESDLRLELIYGAASQVAASDRVIMTDANGRLDSTFLQYNVNFGSNVLSGVASPSASTDAANKAYVDTEATARQNAVTDLQGKINTEKGRIDAILLASDADKDSFAEIVALINSVDTINDTAFGGYVVSNNAALAAEVTARQAADASEAAARSAADTILQSNITAEVSARQSAVIAEQSARQTAFTGLDTRLQAVEAAAVNFVKNGFVLTSTDITNGYVNLTGLAVANSIVASVDRLMIHQGEDFTISTVGGVTRITFAGSLAAAGAEALAAGDVLKFTYAVLAV